MGEYEVKLIGLKRGVCVCVALVFAVDVPFEDNLDVEGRAVLRIAQTQRRVNGFRVQRVVDRRVEIDGSILDVAVREAAHSVNDSHLEQRCLFPKTKKQTNQTNTYINTWKNFNQSDKSSGIFDGRESQFSPSPGK